MDMPRLFPLLFATLLYAAAPAAAVDIPGFSVKGSLLGYEPVISTWSDDLPQRTEFTTTDRQVVFSVDLAIENAEDDRPLKVVWTDPEGKEHGQNAHKPATGKVLNATLPVRNAFASHRPGAWSVKLLAGDATVVERKFTIKKAY